ncbi:MAG: sigma 54-interacting transcriptional regulator [Deltaproteobacteria bacterium]|nr:sigma 54-interacting transcriptional regulator [Deltaproteobacteria bacterium]
MPRRLYHEAEPEQDVVRALMQALRQVCGLELDERRAGEVLAAWRAARAAPGATEAVPGGEEGAADGIVGASPALRELLRRLERAARTDVTVLLQGENGTGKELAARAVHRRSRRAAGPFVAQNCSALPETLLDSTLFGHVRGAFTGAVTDRKGLFEAADGGTLFLDEVGEMSPALQAKLLRVLEDATTTPVGSTTARKVDVRLVAATNRDLPALVRQGVFREDLWHRLSVLTLRVPSLRERPEDVPLLAEHFRRELARRDGLDRPFAPGLLERLQVHRWPGNVRELRHEVERLWVFSGDAPQLGLEHLSPELALATTETAGRKRPAGLHADVAALERERIADALRRTHGNRTQAATLLGISRRNLIRKIARFGLGGPARPSR